MVRRTERPYAWLAPLPAGSKRNAGPAQNGGITPRPAQPSAGFRAPQRPSEAIARRERRHDQKIRVSLERATHETPAALQAHLDLGLYYLKRGSYFLALKPLWAAEALQPGHLWVQASLRETFRKLGQHEAANEHGKIFCSLAAADNAGLLEAAQELERKRYDLHVAMWRDALAEGA